MRSSAVSWLPLALGIATAAPIANTTTYDYIIAGGGAAGLVVAGRLAESGASVLLVERGGPSVASTGGTDFMAWNSSVTQYDVPAMAYYAKATYCSDTASKAGCLLGGGSALNAMMFVPPQDEDFSQWPAGWKAADVRAAYQRFFARVPGTNLPSMDGKRYDQGAYNVMAPFLEANGFTSVEPLKDQNKKTNVFAQPPLMIADGLRSGPLKTYLPQAQALKNFHMSLQTKVVRAVREAGWVSGVEVEKADGSREIIQVTPKTGKVVLAAGTLSTPRILFYSGIGPEDEIKKVPANVTLPAEAEWIKLPVGKGAMDHSILSLKLGTKQPLAAVPTTAFTDPDQASIDLFAHGSGVLAQSGQRLNFWASVDAPIDGKTRFFQGTCNSPANSTVAVKLYITHGLTSSADVVLDAAGVATKFNGNPWLDTEGDQQAMKLMIDRLIRMTQAPNSTMTIKLQNGSVAPANVTAEALYNDAFSTLSAGSHWTKSARMGLDDGRTGGAAVVDTNTKVYGTDNLFIVDASIHPDVPTGNTQAIVMVVAEQAADKILALGGHPTKGPGASACGGSRRA